MHKHISAWAVLYGITASTVPYPLLDKLTWKIYKPAGPQDILYVFLMGIKMYPTSQNYL